MFRNRLSSALRTVLSARAKKGSVRPEVLLVADSPAEQRVSMDCYVSTLESHLRLRVPALAFSVLRAPALRHRGKLARQLRTVIDRYIRLPLAIRMSRASVVHIT